MWRTIAGIAGGLVAWAIIVTAIDWGLRLWMPGYAQAEPVLLFTPTMKIARLCMAAVTSLATGALVRTIAPRSRLAPWIVGLVIVALFVPAHIHLWHRFPIWYHLTFLLTLAPLVALGAALARRALPVAEDPSRQGLTS
jgi:hypothetical protein